MVGTAPPPRFQCCRSLPKSSWRLPIRIPSTRKPRSPSSFPKARGVQVRVFDLLGRAVRVYEQQLSRGSHQWRWDGKDESGIEAASGVYVIRVQVAGFDRMHKVTLLK